MPFTLLSPPFCQRSATVDAAGHAETKSKSDVSLKGCVVGVGWGGEKVMGGGGGGEEGRAVEVNLTAKFSKSFG